MTRVGSLLGAALLVISLAVSATADFAIYPGAQREKQLEQRLAQLAKNDPNSQGVEWELYLSSDPFQRVYEFYKTIGVEDEAMKKIPAPALPNGAAVQWAFFIFDGAKSIRSSKFWLKIQHPLVADPTFKDIRDFTSIQVARKR